MTRDRHNRRHETTGAPLPLSARAWLAMVEARNGKRRGGGS
ncbi:hypothetical protein [Shimia sp.]